VYYAIYMHLQCFEHTVGMSKKEKLRL